jgi:hypothetical protein
MRPVVVLSLAVAAVVIVAGVLLTAPNHIFRHTASHSATTLNDPSAPNSASPATTNGAVAEANVEGQMLSWARANLSAKSVIATDDATLIALKNAGFAAALTFESAAGVAPATIDYVLSMPGVTPSAPQSALTAMALPLAVWGTGTNRASIGQVFAGGAATAQADQSKDAALRLSGGTQLSQNPGISADVTAQAALLAGRLDLRAQNVCAVLATGGHIFLSVNGLDPAEQSAGLPIRSITVTAANASSMQVMLAALTPPFVPTITPISAGKVTLTWPPQIAPVAIVGG